MAIIASPPNFDDWLRDLRGNAYLRTVLEAITDRDDPEHVRCAIRGGFDVSVYGGFYFLQAIGKGRVEIVKMMLEAGANLDCASTASLCNDACRSPLSLACACIRNAESRWKIVELLLEHGASVDFDPERHTESCAHSALMFADCELLELFARCGADLNCLDRVIQHCFSDSLGNTPLHKVMLGIATVPPQDMNTYGIRSNRTEGELRLEMTEKLLELGADVNVANARGSTAMHLMFEGQLSHLAFIETDDEVFSLLLNAGAELNRLNDSGESPISLAAKCCSYHMVKRVIDAGADVNLTRGLTSSALFNAIVGARKNIVKLLLDCGADVDSTDDDGRNFLWVAATKWNEQKAINYIDILKLIMSHSTNKNCIEYEKYVPFGSALEYGTMEVMHLFFENGVQLNNCGVPYPLIRAAANPEVEILEYLLKIRLYDVNAVDKTGSTALFNAVLHERLDCIRILIEWGANVDIPTDPRSEVETAGGSPLSQAVAKGNLEIVDLLLSLDAKIHFDCGNGDKRCFVSAADVRSRSLLAHNNLANSVRIGKCLYGRVVLSQSHFERINPKIRPEIKNCRLKQFLFEGSYYREMFNECLSELDALKSVSFYDCRHNSVTLFDILRGKEITHYVNNAEVVNRYQLLRVSRRFPIYGNLIESRFATARFKRKLVDNALKKLCKVFGFYPWNCDWFLHNVMAYLSVQDLRNLSEL